ncbi:DUF4491 family protein [uncultured Muribaculum sp.]|uniref:DUF4491 family protein n=1 Tax=uncultured Muribaculum sp. TaxID=1918613 RepID=UPI002736B9CC|nr:DUF4491 family protein [uncultured Muribaculum sp.]
MDITSTLQDYHLLGLVIGICTFLVIGLFHPVVVKCEYRYGTSCWWWVLLLGCACTILSLIVSDILGSTILGVVGFSSFWTIKEIFEQQERVRKGWFPRNPKRRYPWDNDASV